MSALKMNLTYIPTGGYMPQNRQVTKLLLIIISVMNTVSYSTTSSANEISDAKLLQLFRSAMSERLAGVDDDPRFKQLDSEELLKREQRLELWSFWASYLDYHIALSGLMEKHRNYLQIEDKNAQTKSFLIFRAAHNMQYRFALELLAKIEQYELLDVLWNEPVAEFGLPAKTFADFKFRFLNVIKGGQFAAIETLSKLQFANSADNALHGDDADAIWNMGRGKGELMTLANAVQVIKNKTAEIVSPVQTKIAETMGDIKVYRPDRVLLSHEQILGLQNKLLPGDILVQRREWYLSNVGIPGFWTHAALYIGTPEERRKYFDNDDVINWVKQQNASADDFESLLASAYPQAYQRATTPYGDNETVRIVEAIGEGVSFTSMEFSSHADSIAILRPKLDKTVIAKTLLKAFYFSDRPYDFDFDFRTDSALVCTELVYKSYEPILKFTVPKMFGRYVLSANDIVKQFATEPETREQFELVGFLDGDEYSAKAVTSSEDVFLESWKRPKWHVLITRADQ